MSRKRTSISLSLFPFLAVLICTMGVLVALLLLVVKQADQTARGGLVQERESLLQQSETLRDRLAEFELRRSLLEDARDGIRDQVLQQRDRRAHLENQIAELQDRARRLEADWLALKQTDGQMDVPLLQRDVADAAETLRELRDRLAKTRQETSEELAEGKAAAVYSIVPIAARSGTNRRPIYIECRDEGIFLHPGGHRLTREDFVRPLQAGNPLDSALVAYREHWMGKSAAQQDGKAYPLLVVRPSGAHWYPLVRRAMQGWVDEFGYELIPEDWEVDFGTSSPALDKRVAQAVEMSLQRQQALMRYGRAVALTDAVERSSNATNGGTILEPADNGGFRAVPASHTSGGSRGLPVGQPAGNGDPLAKLSEVYHQQQRPGSSTETIGENVESLESRTSLVGTAREPFASGNRRERSGWDSKARDGLVGTGANGDWGRGSSGQLLPGNSLTTATGANGGTATGSGRAADSEKASVGSGNAAAAADSIGQTLPAPSPFGNDRPNATSGSRNSPSGSRSEEARSMDHQTAGNTALSLSAGDDRESSPNQTLSSEALARQRGTNWALPARRRNVSAYHRPVPLQVHEDRLILQESPWDRDRVEIPINTTLTESVDPLIDALWKRVDSWGSLGFDGYWKPVLQVRVHDANRAQVQRLEMLLQGSGLSVQRMEN